MSANEYTVVPLTPARWDDFTALFGSHGAVGGCWCMYWRREGAWEGGNGDANREKMHTLVQGGTLTGLLAYAGSDAVGWVSVAPRVDYAALARSRVLAPVDEQPVWSIVCFFIQRGWRRKGVMRALLRGAVDYAAAHGAHIVEA
ncbi:GNAT family N-acetyltransferase, partial [bacterium]